jgi:hypothetical protein
MPIDAAPIQKARRASLRAAATPAAAAARTPQSPSVSDAIVGLREDGVRRRRQDAGDPQDRGLNPVAGPGPEAEPRSCPRLDAIADRGCHQQREGGKQRKEVDLPFRRRDGEHRERPDGHRGRESDERGVGAIARP